MGNQLGKGQLLTISMDLYHQAHADTKKSLLGTVQNRAFAPFESETFLNSGLLKGNHKMQEGGDTGRRQGAIPSSSSSIFCNQTRR